MTEQMAQKWLEQFEFPTDENSDDALATICEALQEYPKFRAIGTVEELQALKEKSDGLIKRLEANIGDNVWFEWSGSNWYRNIHNGTIKRISITKSCIGYKISPTGYNDEITILSSKDDKPCLFKTEEEAFTYLYS